MKAKSVFKSLPEEDQQRILDLCSNHTYDEVLEIIERPRPEGLQLKTSYSALCRFYCTRSAQARQTTILEQAAASLQYVRQSASGSFRTAILGILETRLFTALRAGQPVADLKDEFNVFKDFQKGFIAEERWRWSSGANPEAELEAHRADGQQNAHYDFVPLDDQGQPADIPPLSDEEIADLNACQEILTDDLAELDHRIAALGPRAAEENALADGCSPELVRERIEAYHADLRARGLTPVERAIEARRAELRPSIPSATPANSEGAAASKIEAVALKDPLKTHRKTPANPHNSLKSARNLKRDKNHQSMVSDLLKALTHV